MVCSRPARTKFLNVDQRVALWGFIRLYATFLIFLNRRTDLIFRRNKAFYVRRGPLRFFQYRATYRIFFNFGKKSPDFWFLEFFCWGKPFCESYGLRLVWFCGTDNSFLNNCGKLPRFFFSHVRLFTKMFFFTGG